MSPLLETFNSVPTKEKSLINCNFLHFKIEFAKDTVKCSFSSFAKRYFPYHPSAVAKIGEGSYQLQVHTLKQLRQGHSSNYGSQYHTFSAQVQRDFSGLGMTRVMSNRSRGSRSCRWRTKTEKEFQKYQIGQMKNQSMQKMCDYHSSFHIK